DALVALAVRPLDLPGRARRRADDVDVNAALVGYPEREALGGVVRQLAAGDHDEPVRRLADRGLAVRVAPLRDLADLVVIGQHDEVVVVVLVPGDHVGDRRGAIPRWARVHVRGAPQPPRRRGDRRDLV